MKSIELTEDRKSKLLEMCKILFPEYPLEFGSFYSSEVGAIYIGLEYLDVTHLNHKIPCIVSRYILDHSKINTSDLKIIKKEKCSHNDKLEYGLVNNIESLKQGFMLNDKSEVVQHSGGYDEIYVETIHWFEFCMTHLFYALYDSWRKEDINCVTTFHLDLHNFKIHPIDYLYKKFKKLK